MSNIQKKHSKIKIKQEELESKLSVTEEHIED
jgi:hypothetical protein